MTSRLFLKIKTKIVQQNLNSHFLPLLLGRECTKTCNFQLLVIENTGCPMIKFIFTIHQFLRPLILLRDCSVLDIYVLISPFKRTMFECSSMFTFRDIKHSIEYPHFQSFCTPNFIGPKSYNIQKWLVFEHISLYLVFICAIS